MPAMLSRSSKTSTSETEISKSRDGLKNPISIHLNYAKWKEQIGDLPTATESYQMVLDQEPKNIEAQLGLARIAMMKNHRGEAEVKFREAMKLAPSDPHVLDQVAQFYAEGGEWDRAAVLLEHAVQLNPDHKEYRYHYAVSLAHTGATQNAYREFRHVMGDAETHYNIAHILHQTGNWSGAEQHVNHALRIQPDLVPARNLMAELLKSGGQEMQYVNHETAPRRTSVAQSSHQTGESRRAFHTEPEPEQGFYVPASGQAPPFPASLEYSETTQPVQLP